MKRLFYLAVGLAAGLVAGYLYGFGAENRPRKLWEWWLRNDSAFMRWYIGL